MGISTNELHLAALQLAYNLGVGLAASAFIASYSSVQQLEQVSSPQKRDPSGFIWLVGGSLLIGSVIWIMQLIPMHGVPVLLTGLGTTVLIVLLAVALLLRRRFANARGQPLTNSGEPAENAQTGSTRPLQKLSLVLMAIRRSHSSAIANSVVPGLEALVKPTQQGHLKGRTNANESAATTKELGGRSSLDRDQASTALGESEARYQFLSQNSTDLISRHTPEGLYLYASPACRPLLGYEPDELVGRSIYEFFHTQDLAALSQSHSNILKLPEMDTFSYRIRRQGGDYIWFESTTNPIYHPETGVLEEIVAVSRDITQRKQAEEARHESERQLQKLTANVPGMIYQFLLQTDGSVSFPFVSSGAREIYELEPGFIQQNAAVVIDLIHPEDRESFEDSVAVSAKTLQPWRWEGRFMTASGNLKWLQTASRPELQANGDILWDGMLMDITERKQSEAALYESEQQFKATFEQAGVAIAQVGANGEFLQVNQKLCEITGYSREELLKLTILEITYPEDQAADQMYLNQFFNWERQTLNLEKRYIHKTGSLVWVNVTVSLAREVTGAPKYFIEVIEDITDRKQAQDALQRREEQFRSLIEYASDIITILNSDGTISYKSPSIQRMLGHDPKDLIGLNMLELVHPEDSQRLIKSFKEVVQRPSCGLPVEFRIRHKDGSWHTLEAIGQSLLDEEAGEMKIVVNSRDITERKQAEAAVQKANRDRINIFESITEAFFAVDHEWRFTYINPKAEQVLSRSQEELLGKCVWDEFPHVVGSSFEEQFRRAVAEQVSVKFEEFYQPFALWLHVRAYPYEGGLSVYFKNITERKHAEASLVERSRLSTLAAEVGVALAHGGTLRRILQLCTDAMVQQLHVTSAVVWTLNPVSQQLERQASSGRLLPLKPDLVNLIAQTRQPYLSSEAVEELHSSSLPNHFSGYPLIVEDRLIGVLTLLGNQPLTEEACFTLSWVTNAIAVAIDRYWARSELLSRRESLLFGLANQIRNSLELDTILETAVQSIRSLLRIDRCHVLWYEAHEIAPSWEVVTEARNPSLKSHIGQYTTAQMGPFVDQLLNQQIIQVDEVETFSDRAGRRFLRTLGYTSILSIPIKTQAGKIGVISCGHCTRPRPWDHSEVELLQAVVAQLAIALDQAELYAQARQTAQIAQAQAQKLELALNQLQTTQAQLVHSAKMSSLGQLVAGVAHEINNPINFIHGNLAYASAYFYDLLGLLRLYQEYYPEPADTIVEQAEVINIDFIAKDLPKLLCSMQRGSDRIRSIVLSLRNFSRLDEAEMKKVDLHEGIDNTLLILQHRLQPKDHSCEIQVVKEYGDLPDVECYPGQLNQVFMNILSNAIEALKESLVGNQEHPSPSITIRTSILDSSDSSQKSLSLLNGNHTDKCVGTGALLPQNSKSVVIQITDNGPGMSESVKARLFDPFFTTKPVGQGTGLGLSISYQIVVEHHKGILTCTSAPGQGTEFWIEIPIQQV